MVRNKCKKFSVFYWETQKIHFFSYFIIYNSYVDKKFLFLKNLRIEYNASYNIFLTKIIKKNIECNFTNIFMRIWSLNVVNIVKSRFTIIYYSSHDLIDWYSLLHCTAVL